MPVISPLSYTTHKIIDVLDLDTEQMTDLMSVSRSHYNSFKNNLDKAPLGAIHSFSQKLGLTSENLVKGHVDFEALFEHFRGNSLFIPKRYRQYRESRMQTIANLLESLDPQVADTIIRRIQLNKSHLENPDTKICGLALLDVQREIRRIGLPTGTLEKLAFHSAKKYEKALIKNIPQGTSTKNLFDSVMVNVNDALERNLHYEISHKTLSSIRMKVTTRESLRDALKIKNFGTPEHCCNIRGWASGILQYQRRRPGSVTKRSCVHQGDSSCLYEIDFAFAH